MGPASSSRLGGLIPLGVYVHLPWCVKKCPYCDFNSHPVHGAWSDLEPRYVEALIADLGADRRMHADSLASRVVQSVFFGGGTPSLFSPASIERILVALADQLSLTASCEVTLEANPGTVEAARFTGFKAAGVNRLSIGVQSFHPHHLQALGRIHDAEQAQRAVAGACAAGFERVNLDLMFGLPGQTAPEGERDVEIAIASGVSHLSYYQLTIEPNTRFAVDRPRLPAEDVVEEIQRRGHGLLAQAGFLSYEVSAFCTPGVECRHNLNYWRYGDYLGIGAGAHGKLTNRATGEIERTVKHRHPTRYLAAAMTGEFELERQPVRCSDRPAEFMMNALRLSEGFTDALFEERTGLSIEVVQQVLQRARTEGLLERDGRGWHTTERGRRYLNEVLVLFLD